MKTSNILWGLFFLGGGIALLLWSLGIGQEYEMVRIIVSALLLGLALVSFIRFRFFLSLVPIAFIVYIWQEQLGLEDINLWLLILAVAILSIGLSTIFRKKPNFQKKKKKGKGWIGSENILNDNEFASIETSFGEQTKYIHASNLKRVNIGSNFGSIKVYFDQCKISEEGLIINVSANFSDVVLTMPRDWKVINHVNAFAASVKEKDEFPVDVRTLVELHGSLNFAELKVKYI